MKNALNIKAGDKLEHCNYGECRVIAALKRGVIIAVTSGFYNINRETKEYKVARRDLYELQTDTQLITVPFAGFYETIHESTIELCEAGIFEDSNGNPRTGDTLQDRFFRVCDYKYVHEQYTKAYAEAFAQLFDLKLKFEGLDSPKEYNFVTDRIFCTISKTESKRLHKETNKTTLQKVCKENHTSRSGFVSFYSNDFTTWGKVETWDHNQLATLLEAWMLDNGGKYYNYTDGDAWGYYDEHVISETVREGGQIDNWLCKNPEALRLASIAGYLRERELREYMKGYREGLQ